MANKKKTHQEAGRGKGLDPNLSFPYQTLKAFLPDLSDDGVGLDAGPRKFFGASFDEATGEGLLVRDVIEYTAAKESGLQRGDIVVHMGDQAITNRYDLHCAIDEMDLGKEVSTTILRNEKKHTLTLIPEAVVFVDGDIKGKNVTDKRCDKNCDCTTPRPNTGCQAVWRYRGDGPHGGVLYEKECGALDLRTFKIVDNTSCGTGEYF